MNKLILIIVLVVALGGGTLLFFHVPKQSCVMLRDPSGLPSIVCDPARPSLYQRVFLLQHRYFFPNDECTLGIEANTIDCRTLSSVGCDQSATTTDCLKFAPSRLSAMEQRRSSVPENQKEQVNWRSYISAEFCTSKAIQQKVSSSGSKIAYKIDQDDQELVPPHIGIFDIQTSDCTFLATPECSWAHGALGDYQWSSDGVFLLYEDDCGDEGGSSKEIVAVRADAGEKKRCPAHTLEECELQLNKFSSFSQFFHAPENWRSE